MTRIITLVVAIEDIEQGHAWWDKFRTNEAIFGSRIQVIANGNLSAENDKLNDELERLLEKYPEDFKDMW